MAPVCDTVAFAEAGNRPALYATIGLPRANARAADMNLRASVTFST